MADARGHLGHPPPPPPGTKNFSILCSFFFLILVKFYVGAPAGRLAHPPTEILDPSLTYIYIEMFHSMLATRGGSRIPRRMSYQPSMGAPTYDYAKFSKKRKLHEIENFWDCKGGERRGTPVRSGCGYIY